MRALIAYQEGRGFLHDLHPLSKLTFLGGGLCLSLAADDSRLALWVWFLLLLVVAAESGALRTLVSCLLHTLLPLLVSLLAINTLVGMVTGELAWHGDLVLWWHQATDRIDTTGLRVAVCVTTVLLGVLTTHPGQLAHALTEAGAPPWLGHMLAASLLMVPTTLEQAAAIADAQHARGLPRPQGTPWQRLRASMALLVPLLLGLLQAAEEQARVLEARGAFRPGKRISLVEVEEQPWEPSARRVSLVVIVLGFGAMRGWWHLW